jgi:UDP-N-acetylmuramoyl-tripeptide--D-alanyl-D-alanine ligase
MSINLYQALKKVKHISLNGIPVDRELPVITDTRKVIHESIYVAIKGEQFDGFSFIGEALKKGAVAIVYNASESRVTTIEEMSLNHKNVMFVGVADTISFLQSLANFKRTQWYHPKKHVIGITGSNGKTTTKEMLLGLFQAVPGVKVQATIGNFNNHIGLPLTLLSLEDATTVSLIEMGMNHHNEIDVLCNIALPTSGIITNIGTAHIEYLGSQEEIFKEKSFLYTSVINSSENGVFIINEFDKYCVRLPDHKKTIRSKQNQELSIESFDDESLTLKVHNQVRRLQNLKIYGKHLYQNLGLSILLVASLYPNDLELILTRAENLTLPSNNRAEWVHRKSHLVYLDAYNANPQSMQASLEAFRNRMIKLQYDMNDVLVIIGDMNELGQYAQKYHGEIGEKVKSLKFKNIAYVGKYKKYFSSTCPDAITFDTKADIELWLRSHKDSFKSIFIKGSRSLQLESLLDIV